MGQPTDLITTFSDFKRPIGFVAAHLMDMSLGGGFHSLQNYQGGSKPGRRCFRFRNEK